MDPRQITRLAKLLRENGDKVLSSEYKITLTGSLLRALNDSFSLITDPNEVCTPKTFQVLKPNNAKSDVFRELQIIYDFVQKAQILCLMTVPNDDAFDGTIDISKFRNLRRLEISKIPIERIVGIQRLRAHLQELICSKSISSIQAIIVHCGGDNANGFQWNELKIADFSYNQLKTIDCSLEFVSNLQQLNLSHNKIVSVDAIKWLPNLKKLNLSYNSLTHIPQSIASRRLQTLILTNNFIEDLSNLPKLEALHELNLADNCILDHAALTPLGSLIALQHLQLHGNPISCHPNHREETAKYLHKNTESVKFVLDFQPLNKHEKSLIGHYQSFNTWFAPRKPTAPRYTTGLSTPNRQTKDSTPASSIGSIRSFRIDGSTSSTADLTACSDLLNSSQSSVATQKRIKVRPALIADDDDGSEDVVVEKKKPPKKEKPSITSKEIDEMASREHLETKKQIEELRKEYGTSWLQNEGAAKVLNVMNIQSSVPKSLEISAMQSSSQTAEQMLEHLFPSNDSELIDRNLTSTPIERSNRKDLSQTPKQSTSEFQSCDDTLTTQSEAETTMYESLTYNTSSDEPETLSDTEENEKIYLVTNQANKMDVFVLVSDKSIREKNSLTSKTINKWNMTMLESCERVKRDVLCIRFDTLKRDKKERLYQMTDQDEAQCLDEFLRNILSKRPLSEMNQTVFRCVNCSTQFSREKLLSRKTGVKCPECSSAYVVEIKEKAQSPPRQPAINVELEKCESQSSIAPQSTAAWTNNSNNTLGLSESSDNKTVHTKHSASSFNECLSQSKLSSYSQSSFDSNQSLIGSTTNCDPANDLDLYFASRFGAACESDVEILSNPSISSIEVLERFSRQSSRKQSEDLRCLLQTQLYVQQHQQQFNQSNNGSDCQSPSFDIVIKSTSNSDIEEILDEPGPNEIAAAPIDHVTITDSDGITNICTTDDDPVAIETALKPNKKPILTGMNLTESSSSGSVTDSVITAYESQTSDTKAVEPINIQLVSSMSTKAPITSSEHDSSGIGEDQKDSELTKLEEALTAPTMLGGLFSVSTNLLTQRKVSKVVPVQQCDEFKFCYSEFDDVDHRLKLYLYQNIFEDNNEHLKWLVKGLLFSDVANCDPNGNLQPAIFVMSTTKWYVLHIVGQESDDVGKWLKRQTFGTIDRVEMARVLPWKVGITFSIKFLGNIHLILQDIMRTDSLLLFFANNPLPSYCDLEYQISERISQKLLQITNNTQLKMLAVLNQCKIIVEDDDTAVVTHHYASLIVTDSNVYITKPHYGWLMEKADRLIDVQQTQLMMDLVDVEHIDDTSFYISFMDDVNDHKEKWECIFETNSCLQNTFDAIAQSWEKLFKVPLAN